MELFKLHVENLGRIKQAELSIRPLTVFVGPNNTNKTWTAYALYGLARWLSWDFARFRPYGKSDLPPDVDLDVKLDEVVEQAVKQRVDMLSPTGEDAVVLVRIGRVGMLEEITYPVRIRLNPARLAQLVGISQELAKKAQVSAEFSKEQLSSARFDSISFRFDAPSADVRSVLVIRGAEGGRYRATESQEGEFARSVLRMGVESVLLGRFEQAVPLPAERKALVTVGGLLPDQKTRQVLSEPGVDFLTFLQNSKAMWDRHGDQVCAPDALALLEERLLEGSLTTEGPGGSGALLYSADEGPTLTMQAASSMVRALAALNLYLRGRPAPGDLLLIDEPEMNAHPEAQLMIAELLGILVNKGINVVITTHSPYIVDHINNLVEASHLCEEKQKEIAGRFKLQTKDAFVPEENVATYEFHDDGQVTNVFDRGERLIDWDTFGKVSDEVSKLFNDILVAAHEE